MILVLTFRKLRNTSGSMSGILIIGSLVFIGPKKRFSKYGEDAERIVLCPKIGASIGPTKNFMSLSLSLFTRHVVLSFILAFVSCQLCTTADEAGVVELEDCSKSLSALVLAGPNLKAQIINLLITTYNPLFYVWHCSCFKNNVLLTFSV